MWEQKEDPRDEVFYGKQEVNGGSKIKLSCGSLISTNLQFSHLTT